MDVRKDMKQSRTIKPGMTPREIVNTLRAEQGVFLTSTGMRDAGQSDFKNRHRMYDLATLAPFYNDMACSALNATAARAGMWA